jgi:hypothetical protein
MNNTHTLSGSFPMVTDAAGINSGQTFLTGELERMDQRLREPLATTTWARDIVAVTGNGFADYISAHFVEYATAGANQFGIISGSTNAIPIIQGNVTKDLWKTHNFMNMIRVPFMDETRMSAAGRSLSQIFENGLRKNWDLSIQQSVYLGFTDYGTTGLINNPSVTSALVAQNAGATSRLWANKTAEEILNDVNSLIFSVWSSTEFTLYPNHILLPPADYNRLATRLISQAGNQSVLSYLMANNLASMNGENLVIVPCRQTVGAGLPLTTGGANTNRMVAYRNEEEYLSFDMTVPLYRLYTSQSAADVAYMSPYFGQFSEVKVMYPQTIAYRDGV